MKLTADEALAEFKPFPDVCCSVFFQHQHQRVRVSRHSVSRGSRFHRGAGNTDRTRLFSKQCDLYKVVRVVRGNRSDNHCNRSDTGPALLLPEL